MARRDALAGHLLAALDRADAEAGEVVAELEEAGEDVVHVGEIADGPRGCTVRGPAGSWDSASAWQATHNA